MLKYSICNEVFEGWTWPDTVRAVAKAGYDGIEIAPFTLAESVEDLSPAERATIRAQAEDAGLDVVGLHWLFVSPKGLHTTTDDDATRRRTTAYMQALIRFCGDVGGQVMIIGSPQQRDVQTGVPYRVAWRRFTDMIGACLDLAESRGVTLCMEALAPDQTNFCTSLDEAVQMVREIGHPRFQTMFDVHNARLETEPLPDLVRRHLPYIRHVHVNEMDGGYPGSGDFDFGAILRVLEEKAFDGYVSAEVFDATPGATFIARETLVHLRAAARS
jgi:sugar phosphate isomerase/epimerase